MSDDDIFKEFLVEEAKSLSKAQIKRLEKKKNPRVPRDTTVEPISTKLEIKKNTKKMKPSKLIAEIKTNQELKKKLEEEELKRLHDEKLAIALEQEKLNKENLRRDAQRCATLEEVARQKKNQDAINLEKVNETRRRQILLTREMKSKPKIVKISPKPMKSASETINDKTIEEIKNVEGITCCIMGHVDAGKTSLFDSLCSTTVTKSEAGNITQQLRGHLIYNDICNVLLLDTPGHAVFKKVREMGSNICNVAILVIDIMHGIKDQTIESIQLLDEYNIPFIVALTKVDLIYEKEYETHYNTLLQNIKKNFIKIGIDTDNMLMIPCSSKTRQGTNEILDEVCKFQVESSDEFKAYIVNFNISSEQGATIDVVQNSGTLAINDLFYIGQDQYRIKSLQLTNSKTFVKHSTGPNYITIAAPSLTSSVATLGTRLSLVPCMDILATNTITSVDKTSNGIWIQCDSKMSVDIIQGYFIENKIPCKGYGIGELMKKHVTAASASVTDVVDASMKCIVSYNIDVSPQLIKFCKDEGITLIASDVVYTIFSKVEKYMQNLQDEFKSRLKDDNKVVYPCILEILKDHVYHKSDPMLLGCKVLDGKVEIGTPLCAVVNNKIIEIGKVESIRHGKSDVLSANTGKEVCLKIANIDKSLVFGKQFDHTNSLLSRITRDSIDILKLHFKKDVAESDWKCIIKLKKLLSI